jgi:predicted AlkP superfamily phosphohydrolase/phosphomutase
MIDQGDLPTLAKIASEGAFAVIDCEVGMLSPVVWTTVATGVPPDEHGITGFTLGDTPATSTARKRAALWNILPRYGISMATVGWMVTWPSEEDAGIVISDRAHWGEFPNKVAPEGVIDPDDYRYRGMPSSLAFLRNFTSYPFDPDFEELPHDDPAYAVNFLLKRRLINIYARDRTYADIAKTVVEQNSLDVLSVYLQGVDYTSHGFWQYFEPDPYREAGWVIDPEHVDQLKDIIPGYYMYVDSLLGELLELVDPEAHVMVLSDHGFGTGLGKYRVEAGTFISGNHRPQGALLMSGPGVQTGLEQRGRITHFDILPTIIYQLGLPQARDLHGSPLVQYFTDQAIAARTIRFLDSYDDDGTRSGLAQESRHDEEILKELRALGYIR